MSERVRIERDEGVVHVQMNRPEKRNALDGPMQEALLSAARALRTDRTVRAVVLSGAGPAFCAGLDMMHFGEMASGDLNAERADVQEAARDLSPAGANRPQQVAWLWHELPVPVIAAIQGAAYGAGLHIALGADLRIVAPDARLAFVEINWGLVPDLSATQALRRLVPLDVAKRLALTGEPVSGERAVALGLATEVSEQPLEDALALAHTIAQKSPDAVRTALELLNSSALVPVAEGLANEFRAAARLMGGKNQIEAVLARLENRPARFVDPD